MTVNRELIYYENTGNDKVEFLEKKLKKLKENFDMFHNDLNFWEQRDYTASLKRIKKIFKEKIKNKPV